MSELEIKETPINSPIKPIFKNNFLIRISWYDKLTREHQSGSWHYKETINEKIKWVQQQNKRYPFTHYWLEGCYLEKNEDIVDIYEKDYKAYPNIETFNVVPVCKYNSNEYEYILL
jgi:hypothetical protein